MVAGDISQKYPVLTVVPADVEPRRKGRRQGDAALADLEVAANTVSNQQMPLRVHEPGKGCDGGPMAMYVAYVDQQDGTFGLTFPDAPGCTARGTTTREIVENGTAALREWMNDRAADGLPPPAPRSHDVAVADPDRQGRLVVLIRLTAR